MTFWKTDHFKALQRAWYQRLAEDGFRDAEELEDGDLVLKRHAPPLYRCEEEMRRELRESYYLTMTQKLREAEFRTDVDRIILTGYCEGKKAVTICEELRRLGMPRFRHSIRFTVRRYEVLWGLRQYTPRQLGRKAS